MTNYYPGFSNIEETFKNETVINFADASLNYISKSSIEKKTISTIVYDENNDKTVNTTSYNRSTSSSPVYSIVEDPLLKKATSELYNLILNDDFRVGYDTNSSMYFNNLLKSNPDIARKCIQLVFADYFDNSKISYGILSILSNVDYEDIYPEGQLIAMASTVVKDKYVKEAFVRLFENWCNEDALRFIECISFEEKWLEAYRLEVIEDIKEYL